MAQIDRNDKDGFGLDVEASCRQVGRLIRESGYTDKELSEKLGLTFQSVNKWRHARNLPDIENLFMMSRLFGKRVDDFLVGKGQSPEEERAARCIVIEKMICRFLVETPGAGSTTGSSRRLREYLKQLANMPESGAA